MIKYLFYFIFLFAFVMAENTAQQTVTIEIISINDIDLSGADPVITFRPLLGSQNLSQESDAYAISIFSNDGSTKKITGQLENNMTQNQLQHSDSYCFLHNSLSQQHYYYRCNNEQVTIH